MSEKKDLMISEETVHDVITEIQDAFYDIPFENSKFQTENFVLNNQITPARAYRALGLRINAKLRALTEAKYSKMRAEIDIEEKIDQIQSGK